MNIKSYHVEHIPFQSHLFQVTNPNFLTNAKTMSRILSQLKAMLSYHSRIIIIRLDLHPAFFTEDNKQISDFTKRINAWIKNKYTVTRVGYVWVREKHDSDKQHYHFAWILDQHKVKHPHNIMVRAGELWDYITDGTHHKPKNCYHIVKRNEYNEKTGHAIARLSYLAKDKGKGYTKKSYKNYSTSRIKPNEEML